MSIRSTNVAFADNRRALGVRLGSLLQAWSWAKGAPIGQRCFAPFAQWTARLGRRSIRVYSNMECVQTDSWENVVRKQRWFPNWKAIAEPSIGKNCPVGRFFPTFSCYKRFGIRKAWTSNLKTIKPSTKMTLNTTQIPESCLASVSGSTFVNADCFDVFPFIEDKSIDAIICDLP